MDFDSEILFSLARQGIESEWDSSREIPDLDPVYLEKGASFVTLTKSGKLRGCIGSLVAYQPLWEDIRKNAYNAAFRDFRFTPLTQSEYSSVAVEISILTPPEHVEFSTEEDLRNKIAQGRDGVVLTSQGRRATFLPQVWEQLPDFTLFFSHLFQKAGLGPKPDFSNCSIERYSVRKYHE